MEKACNPYAWEDPRFLFSFKTTCVSENVNFILFTYIVSILFGVTINSCYGISSAPIIAGVVATISLIPTFMKIRNIKENFTSYSQPTDADISTPASTFSPPAAPSSLFNKDIANPFNNVTPDEIKYNPTREAAAPITSIDKKFELDDYFRTQWYSDPTDVFGKTQGQRQFVTMASTTIPNDQGSFQDWLYKIPGKTCKEGNGDACYGGTDGGVLPWLNL